MSSINQFPKLLLAIKELSIACDGATTKDRKGFNKVDTNYGNSLATFSVFSRKQAARAFRMVRTYHGQIKAMGYNCEEIAKEFWTGMRLNLTLTIEKENGIFVGTITEGLNIEGLKVREISASDENEIFLIEKIKAELNKEHMTGRMRLCRLY